MASSLDPELLPSGDNLPGAPRVTKCRITRADPPYPRLGRCGQMDKRDGFLLLGCLAALLLGCPEEEMDDDSAVEELPALVAPGDLEGLIVEEGYQLRWTDTNDGVAGYRVEGKGPQDSAFAPLDELDPGTQSFLDGAFDPGSRPVYRVLAVDGERQSDPAELDSELRYWTYARLIGYDALWGDAGPTRQELISGHVTWDLQQKASAADNFHLLLLGDWYGDEGSVYVHAVAGGSEILEQDELNMGDERTYRDFFDWMVASYPAQHYVISYWSHGGGSARSDRDIGYDYTDDDSLDPEETGGMLAYLAEITGQPVEVFSVCACLTQMVENAYALKDAVRYFVAGESVVGCGCDVLDVMWDAPDQSALEIADATVAAHHSSQYPNDVVFASVDVSEVAAMADHFDALARALDTFASVDEANAEAIKEAANATQNMNYNPGYGSVYCEYLDVVDLCDNLQGIGDADVEAEAAAVSAFVQGELLTSMMLQNDYSGMYADAHGISILHPTPNYHWYDADSYGALSFCLDTYWDEYIGGLY